MEHRVYVDVDETFETIALLIDAHGGPTVRGTQRKLFGEGEQNAGDAELWRLYEACARFEEAVAAHVEMPEAYAFLFREREPCAALAHALWLYRCYPGVADAGERRRIAIANLATGLMDEDVPVKDEPQFFAWLDALDVSPDARYDLLKFYHRFDEYEGVLRAQVDALAPIMREHMPLVRDIIDERMGHVRDGIASRGIAFFGEELNVRLDDAHACDIRPSIVRPNAMYMFGQDTQSRIEVVFGVAMFDTKRFVEAQHGDEKRLLGFAKALADPTKWNILMALRRESLYSMQLAERMGLSGATISHHMQGLTSLGVVTVRKEGNRVYYEINQGAMEGLLGDLARQLVPEEGRRG